MWSATLGSKSVSRIWARSRDERVGIVLIGGRLEVVMFAGFRRSRIGGDGMTWKLRMVAIRALDSRL